jgi:hypothetical protein
MRQLVALLIAAVLAPVAAPAGQRDAPPLPELLSGAAAYAERFEREFAVVVGEERYVQQVRQQRGIEFFDARRFSRSLVSHVFLMWVSDGPLLIMARNVRTVDDKVVADSAQRLERLLSSASADPSAKQRLVRDETARFNIGSIIRNFSDPTLVVQFLHARLQSRFSFSVAGRDNVAGVVTWKLAYVEREGPTVIVVNGRNAMASGYVWIAVKDNAVVRATLGVTQSIRPAADLDEQVFAARLETTYLHDARLDVWAPRTMTERYEIWRGGQWKESISSKAAYSNFRRFETSGRLVN